MHKASLKITTLVLLVLTGKVIMPIIVRDLTPPMDTGIFSVVFEAYPHFSL